MGFEVEVKYRVADPAALRARLEALGAEALPPIEQEDRYLAHPARDFARSDEALRLRRDGPALVVTYKGPKRGGPTKTREEIELPLAGGPAALGPAQTLFERLGFRPVASIRKRRQPFRVESDGRPVAVVLDAAEGLGDFAEVEALAGDESDLPAAQAAVLALADRLGLAEVEPRSYLRMTLEGRAAAGLDGGGASP